MYIQKSRGPRTDPWGTPKVTLQIPDWHPPTTAVWLRFVTKDLIQVKV